MRKEINKSNFQEDLLLWIPLICLVLTGLIMVYSSSASKAEQIYGSEYYFLIKQASYLGLGFIALLFFKNFSYKYLAKLAYPILLISLILMFIVLFKSYGHYAGGARRWLHLGPLAFQPSELAKYSLIIYMAYSLNKKQEHIKDFSIAFLPHCIVIAIFAVLLLYQPDMGSIIIMVFIAWVLMFLAGLPIRYLVLSLIPALPILAWSIYKSPYRMRRILSLIDPWARAHDEGFQVTRALMAFGNGGFFGLGLGNGRMKMNYIPESHTDFIFAIIGEESGLFGVLIILALYGIIFSRGMHIAIKTKDGFASYLAAGISIVMALQVIVNTGGNLGIFPLKGLTLPFLSYGGTSLILNLAAIGMLMNISKHLSKE